MAPSASVLQPASGTGSAVTAPTTPPRRRWSAQMVGAVLLILDLELEPGVRPCRGHAEDRLEPGGQRVRIDGDGQVDGAAPFAQLQPHVLLEDDHLPRRAHERLAHLRRMKQLS